MTDSHVESWVEEIKVRWEIQDMGTVDVKAFVIMMYLKKYEQSGTETKHRRKRRGLM